ncbi:tyrosine-type recombinase/integrase [Nocardioides sp. Leaf374]|uniref:tyrosine-type recombinase/integrase n=1 Tax=Nocardioides sp. Leaf374 TaxID=2876560 RepID=UPI003A5CC3DB
MQVLAEGAKPDVGDLAAFLFGTGCRVSEALHCVSWPMLTSTLNRPCRGTKTAQADRLQSISTDLTERLRLRVDAQGPRGLLFGVTYVATKAGQSRDRNDVSKALRRMFAVAGRQWAGTHTFRRSVASWLNVAGAQPAEIANQLGHADTNLTAGYLGRKTQPTRPPDVMVLPTPEATPRAVELGNKLGNRPKRRQGLTCVSAGQALSLVAGAGFEPATSGL